MIVTISQLAPSLSAYLASDFPDVTFYEDPLQQGVDLPAMFLQTRSSGIRKATSGEYLWTLRLDLVYLLDFNLPNLQRQYQAAAELLDIALETFPYTDGTSTQLLRTYNRDWTIDLNELHYRFDLQIFVTPEEISVLMQTLDLEMEVS